MASEKRIMKEHIQGLSSEQMKAVTDSNSVFLTAIPGSGKTRSLINRILHQYTPNEIRRSIAITYTRRASEEIEDRIFEQLGELPSNIWTGTIHKFCLEYVVRGYGSYSKYFSTNFQVLGEQDEKEIKDELRKKYEINQYSFIDFTLNVAGKPNDKIHEKLVEEYYKNISELNKIDFNYIIYESYRILNNYAHIRKQLSKKLKLICIDEYQDTQELQYQIISLIVKENSDINMFIVGDSNQSIYDGVGAVVKSHEQLNKIFNRDFQTYNLTECYRSHQQIIDFYKNFAVDNYEMVSKSTIWKNPQININIDKNKDEVFEDIFSNIENLLDNGYPPNEIAIVAPQWHHLYDFSNKLKKRFPEVKMDAPNIVPLKKDEDSIIFKICKIILANVDYYNVRRIKYISKDIIKQFQDDYGFDIDMGETEFVNLIIKSKVDNNVGTQYLYGTLLVIFERLKLLEYFKTDIDLFIKSTINRIKKFENEGIEDDKSFFEQSLRSKSGIVVSTAHGIKGEEYAVIFAFGLLEGFIPHISDLKFSNIKDEYDRTPDANHKSKRLLFVIASRAKEQIFFYSEADRTMKGGRKYKINKDILKISKLYRNILL